ncbi:Peroxidase, family 2-domain-containing protein [Paraphoma chrysanthemicola]|uniref:Peroxidase, family 2-domain-containing protein n=1 Tax=Paraphoma chrysanthemicola TaxID=798071 RepID=A0A8K0W430_9PLEO|nr:Peroxidase, family 2-domain-containing protein [Paraphoma chrysanthemicola]
MVNILFFVLANLQLPAASAGLLGLPLDIGGLLSSLHPAPANDPRFTNFSPPGAGDVRSPCPGLNALANHGFLHHNGRNMTIPHLIKGLSEGLNIGPDFTASLGGLALRAAPNPASGAFDLNELIAVEHDASISRQDAAFGSAATFDERTWAQYLSVFKGRSTADVQTAAKAKFARYNDSLSHNPDFVYGAREAVLAYGEQAVYLQTMGSDTISPRAKLSFVRTLFEQERLPYGQGWRPSTVPITLASVGAMVVQLIASGSEPVPEVGRIVGDTYKSLVVSAVGGSQVLSNLTEGISAVLGL